MWLCSCNAVNEGMVRKAIEDGVKTWRGLMKETKISTQCGKCALHSKAYFEQELAKKAEQPAKDQGERKHDDE
jgi:bacterioferritin-associated ferredoxin